MVGDLPEGYNVERVEGWVRAHVPGLSPPFVWSRLAGGHSNLTYRLLDNAGFRAVIRRPPLGTLLPKAHDMAREWTLIAALSKTDVPVPAPLGFCEDLSVTGAHFYIMGHVEGHALYTARDTERYVPAGRRAAMAFSFIDALAALHGLDPETVGLGGLGKTEGYIARQVKTWYRSWLASVEPAGLDDRRAHDLQRYFVEHAPEQGPARIVHGDFGLHNCLVSDEGAIAAVLDWEISTLGDPLADLAYALNPWPDPTDPLPPPEASPTAPAGFPSRTELAERYALKTGRNLDELDFYTGFNRWKSACIVHGVYARYLEGKKSADGVDLEALRETVLRSLELSEQAISRHEGRRNRQVSIGSAHGSGKGKTSSESEPEHYRE